MYFKKKFICTVPKILTNLFTGNKIEKLKVAREKLNSLRDLPEK